MEEQKRCPFCDELIRASAIKCRYCGSAIIDKSQQKDLNLNTGIHQALDPKYEIIEEIGKGGMAKVYKAIHRNLNRVVALKIIHQNLIHDEETVLRFRREAQLGASLLHPNIVMVFDEGRVNDIIYMSLEFLEGDDLHKIIRKKGKLSLQETVDIIAPTAEALDYVHQRNLVHRDVKSSNIFLANGNRAVLTDFGIAYARESESNLTRAGEVIGTPEFMSPEQASGVKVDGRSDLFSLGIVIYQCLTGKVPFKGDSHLSTIFQITRDPVPNILNLNKELPEWIVPVLEKCLEKQPENRIQTGNELAQLLRNSSNPKIIVPIQEDEKTLDHTNTPEKSIINDDEVEDIIAEAEELFDNNKYKRAKEQYERALQIRPEDQYVIGKIDHLSRILETIEKAENEKSLVQEKYNLAISRGDTLFDENNYDKATKEYLEARSLKRFEKYPKKKIREIEGILNEIKIEKEKKAKEKAYSEKTAEAEVLISNNKWEEAKGVLYSALEIKPNDTVAKAKIEEINSEIERLKKEKEELEAREKTFYLEIANAASLFNSGELEKALASYIKAKELKPNEDYVSSKIVEIQKKIEQIRIEEQKRIATEEAFQEELSLADGLFSAGDFENALESYKKASGIKPDEKDVLSKIEEVEDKIEQIRREEQERLAQLALSEKEKKDLDKKYQNLLKKGDELFTQSLFEDSIEEYKEALKLKPDERYPISRIELINEKIKSTNLLNKEKEQKERAYKKALEKAETYLSKKRYEEAKISYELANSINNNSEYPIKKINEIDSILEQLNKEHDIKVNLDQEYNELINKANALQKDSNFHNAIELLEKAALINPDAKFPKEKIEAIRLTIEIQKKAKEEQALNNKIFQSAATKAEKLLNDNKFLEAKSTFEIALTVQPGNEDIIAKIKLVEEKIENESKRNAEILKKEEEYHQLVADAQEAFVEKHYEDCLKLYQDALNLKPTDDFLKQQIVIIQRTIKEIRNSEQENIAIEKTLKSTLTSAYSLLKDNKYIEAKTAFGIALSIKPDDKEIIKALSEIEDKIKIQKQNKENEKSKIELYKTTIEFATKHYKKEKYTDALKEFKKAAELQPNENYPKDRISEINKIIKGKNKADEEKKIKKELIVKAIQLSDKQKKQKQYNDAKVSLEEVQILDIDNKEIASKIAKVDELIKKENNNKEEKSSKPSADLPDQTIEDKTISLKINHINTFVEPVEPKHEIIEPELESDNDINYSDVPKKPKSEKNLKLVFTIAAITIVMVLIGGIFLMNNQNTENPKDSETGAAKDSVVKPPKEIKKPAVNESSSKEYDQLILLAEENEEIGTSDGIKEAIKLYNLALPLSKDDKIIKSKISKLDSQLKIIEIESKVKRAQQEVKKNTLESTKQAIKEYKSALDIKDNDTISSKINSLNRKIKSYENIISTANSEYNTIEKVDIEIKSQKQKLSLELYEESVKIFVPDDKIKKRIRELKKVLE